MIDLYPIRHVGVRWLEVDDVDVCRARRRTHPGTDAPAQIDHGHPFQVRELGIHRVPSLASVSGRYRIRRVNDSPPQAVQVWHGSPLSTYSIQPMASRHRPLRHRSMSRLHRATAPSDAALLTTSDRAVPLSNQRSAAYGCSPSQTASRGTYSDRSARPGGKRRDYRGIQW